MGRSEIDGRHQAASDFLFDLWQGGRIADRLPPELMPASRQEAYTVQSLIEKRSRQPRFGWKIAATSKAGQAHIGIGGPIAGRLIGERAFADGAELVFGANRMRVRTCNARLLGNVPMVIAPTTVGDTLVARSRPTC